MLPTENIRLIAFDADDTLWDCQSHFELVEKRYREILSPYGDDEHIHAAFFKTEVDNMEMLGYGVKAFTISMIENAIGISNGQVSANDLGSILRMGKELLTFETTPLPGVRTTLKAIRATGRWKMVCFTKGELQDQENKLKRSGLAPLFDDTIIVSDKTEQEYRRLCHNAAIRPEELIMVGNSFKSDVIPALNIGAWAVHIPFHVTWGLEQTEEYDHERLVSIETFDRLLHILGIHHSSEDEA